MDELHFRLRVERSSVQAGGTTPALFAIQHDCQLCKCVVNEPFISHSASQANSLALL